MIVALFHAHSLNWRAIRFYFWRDFYLIVSLFIVSKLPTKMYDSPDTFRYSDIFSTFYTFAPHIVEENTKKKLIYYIAYACCTSANWFIPTYFIQHLSSRVVKNYEVQTTHTKDKKESKTNKLKSVQSVQQNICDELMQSVLCECISFLSSSCVAPSHNIFVLVIFVWLGTYRA